MSIIYYLRATLIETVDQVDYQSDLDKDKSTPVVNLKKPTFRTLGLRRATFCSVEGAKFPTKPSISLASRRSITVSFN